VSDAARRADADVIDMESYLVETLAKMDRVIRDLTEDRHDIAMRLAVIRATTAEGVERAVAEYEQRLASGEPFTGEDAESLLSEAHRRYGS
jgi:hypothetical protein